MTCSTPPCGIARVFTVLFSFLIMGLAPLHGQMTGITVEAVANHDTTGIAALAGRTTYRFYATFTNPTDKISAVYGDASAPLTLSSSDGFYNAMFGGDFALDVNPALFSFFYETAYDSWFTIGFAPGDSPSSNLTAVGLAAQLAAFNATGQIDLGDAVGGSYFTTDDPHAIAGDDLKVLLGQLTTSGSFTGVFNVQVFVGGSASNEQLMEGVVFTNTGDPVFGCTDPEAENYDSEAMINDGSCLYACALTLTGNVIDATCPGGDDGEITLTASGEQFEVLYGLDGAIPNQLLGHFVDLNVGEHHVVALDGAGCLDTLYFTVGSPDPFDVVATSIAAVCEGPGGALTLEASGGTAPYTYTLFGVSNSYGAFAVVPEGVHTVTVTDGLGCNAALQVEVIGVSDAVANPVTSASCSEPSAGSVVLLLNGTTPDEVEWLIGSAGTAMDENGLASSLTAGNYTAVLSSGTCADTVMWTVDLEVDLDNFSAIASDASCAGFADGTIQILGADETWNLTLGEESQNWSPQGITGLGSGDYTVTASSNAECTVNFSVTIDEPAPLSWSVETTDPLCDGDATGSLTAVLNGGTGPWMWSVNGMGFEPIDGVEQLLNLNPGTYAVIGEDANACTASTVAIIAWPNPISSPEALVVAPTTYANGAATALVDPSFELSWTDAAGNLLGTTATLNGLAASTITLTATNAEGCSASSEVLIPFAGCASVGAADWPEEATGWYPTTIATVETNADFSLEWVLQLPASITPPTADIALPVTSFLPESISGLPTGVTATADFSQAVSVDDAWCIELNGSAAPAGIYPVTVTGTFYIEFFGSIFPAPGFTYMKALVVENFTPSTPVLGCTYAWAANFNPSASVDDGSCEIEGCLEPSACNYQPLATVPVACDYDCYGCTYPEADNYNALAVEDDGTCLFPTNGGGGGCMWDGDGNNYINLNDLLLFLGQYDSPCD